MRFHSIRMTILACALVLAAQVTVRAAAQQSGDDPKSSTAASSAAPAAAQPAQEEDDKQVKLGQPDFTLVALPTALRLPKFKSAFRVTHRFLRPLNEGTFGELASDFFALDSGAQIGLEYRFGIVPGGQVGIYRTNDRTISFFGSYDVLRQGHLPFDVTAIASIDGTNNFQDSYSPSLGAIVSRVFGEHAAVYVEPIWVNNTNDLPSQVVDHNDTFMVGIGARVRVRPSVYLVGEITPRAAGYKPGKNQGSFAIEKRVGGHVFQLNFSNGYATNMRYIARGASTSNDWYMGFNISRKFY